MTEPGFELLSPCLMSLHSLEGKWFELPGLKWLMWAGLQRGLRSCKSQALEDPSTSTAEPQGLA